MSIVFEKNSTVKQILFSVIKRFRKDKIKFAELDAEILVMFVLKKSREWICANLDYKLSKNELNRIKKMAYRRIQNEPIAYIIKNREFYGLNFFVNKNVLIPRPETELIIEETLRILKKGKSKNYVIADIGTGSGCIIIALAKNLIKNPISDLRYPISETRNLKSEIRFLGSDISKKALYIARKNAKIHKVNKIIKFYHGDLLSPIIKNAESKIKNSNLVIIANLPYLTANECKEKSIQREPKAALLGGTDGLKYYRELFLQLSEFKTKNEFKNKINILIEINPHQTKKISLIIKRIFPSVKIKIIKDLARKNRVISMTV
ncbi:peptide chain release factor N(5)-glutamine methyltransferase [Candidatus Parcubacteria bacterium]|nr:peptide chain release factor N(5)-glutamine methyltransferase [Candidatus Parcubacteria bacterium]